MLCQCASNETDKSLVKAHFTLREVCRKVFFLWAVFNVTQQANLFATSACRTIHFLYSYILEGKEIKIATILIF